MKPSSDPLRAFLWGKRGARRHALALDVEVHGTQDQVTGLSLDVSATGALLRFDVADLLPQTGADIDPFLLAETHFRGPRVARFQRHRLKVHLEVVRLDYRPDDERFLYVGFRFSRPLTDKQLRRLGLDPTHCGPEAHGLPSELIRLRAAHDPVLCRIYDVADAQRPMFEGSFLGRGEGTLCVRLDGADLSLVATRLGHAPVRIEILDGDRPDWEAHARLQAIGLIGSPPGSLELGLLEEAGPGRARGSAARDAASRPA